MRWVINNSSRASNIKSPTTFYLTQFTEESLRAFNYAVGDSIASGQPLFPIYIETLGGNVDIMNGMLSCMDSAREKGIIFSTIVSGFAASAGAMIFCYGDEGYRFMGSQARLMLHHSNIIGGGKITEISPHYSKLLADEFSLLEKISINLKKPKKWLEKLFDKEKNSDIYYSAQECVTNGIASAIKIPTFVLSVEEKYSIV